MKVSCNGEELLDVELRDEICNRTNLKKPWHVYWSREIAQFYFPSGDTASISFRTREMSDMDGDKTDDNKDDVDDVDDMDDTTDADMDEDKEMDDTDMEDADMDEEDTSGDMEPILCAGNERMIPCPKNPCDSLGCLRYPNA